MTDVAVIDAVGLRLPEDSPALRPHALPEAGHTEDYLAKYDRHTLIYDCVRLDDRRVLLICPRLWTLWPGVRSGLRAGGRPVRRLSRRVFPRYEALVLHAAGEIGVRMAGLDATLVPRPSLAPRFAGTNAAVTINRNNPLDWVASWLRFHVKAHGLDAFVLLDNDSDAYGPDDLAAAIAAVPGLRAAAVLRCPYPYGPRIAPVAAAKPAKFLQSAMLNLARLEALSRARAVLNADIDELVIGPSGRSVFAAAARSPFGVVNIGGSFAFPPDGTTASTGHAAHRFRAVPDRPSPRKWCAAPRGLLSRMGWFIHQVGGEAFKLVPESRDFRLVHCAAANPRWPANRPDRVAPDPALAAQLDAAL